MLVSRRVQHLLAEERELLADLRAFLEAQGAPEEAVRHARAALRGLDETFLLVVVGEFNAGKSSFLNALLNTTLLPEGVTPTTDRIYVLIHGENAGDLEPTGDPYVVRQTVPLNTLEGVAVVDTPGTNAVIRRHQVLTEGFLPRADLLLFLTSAERPFTESERQFLELARRWGRTVVLIVNKADLLESEADREQVRAFVSTHAREVLGFAPPVYLLSARREQRGGDADFARFRHDIAARLGEAERVRLKLQGPLGVARELLAAEAERAEAAGRILKADLEAIERLEVQSRTHTAASEAELGTQLTRVDDLLRAFEARAVRFIERRLRISRVPDLLRKERLEADFQTEAVGELPAALEGVLSGIVDRFVENNLRFWEDVQTSLDARQREQLPRTRFQYDRQALIASLSDKARRQVSEVTQRDLAARLANDAQAAVTQGGLTAAGGIGLGALTLALFSSLAVDVTGVLLGLAVTTMGVLVLPARRRTALRKLHETVAGAREAIHALIRREYAAEQERANARLRDAVAPYTRFVLAERERLEASGKRLKALQAESERLSGEVRHLGAAELKPEEP
ncbi:small GTP-binding protein [Deinobacterium chartae]|uniref:Small GTP-binding protein n=1 Tax=Deinobacterium chartae TaxID=521158 RepID=A0A841I1U6_9DEIO|nr:dynamin family protein [Deinobacterium chartae]MBB6099791.1 small GTP-binding protein [Deinobacterium chartae]